MWIKKQRSLLRNCTKSGVKTNKKVFISKYARIFTNSGVKTKKSCSSQKTRQFYEFRGETTKKICEETVLAHEFCGKNQYLGSLRPWTAIQWHRACCFLWGTILAWGAQLSFGGTSSDLGGTAPECYPWRRACCNFTTIYRTVTIAFLFKRYCSKSVLLKKWELFEVIKRYPKPFSINFCICENTI